MNLVIRTLAALVARAPRFVILGVLVMTIVFGGLSTLVQTADGQGGFAPESEEILAAERIGALFGESATQTVMQIVVRAPGGDVLGVDGLAVTAAVTEAIRSSAAGAYVSADPARPGIVAFTLPVEQALAQQPLDPATLDDATVKELYAMALEAAGPELGVVAQLIPEGSGATPEVGLMLVFVDASAEMDVQVARELLVADAIATVDPAGFELRPFSFNLLFDGSNDDIVGEIGILFGLAFLIIIVVLLFVYWLKPNGATSRRAALRRTVADTAVTMLTIVLAIVWMNGIGGALQQLGLLGEFTEIAQIVPILLIGLGVDYGIHLTSRYRDEVGRGAGVDAGIGRAIGTVGVALALATIATAIGFLTNVINPIPALRDFGILAAIGIVASFLLMLTFVPAVRSLLDRRAEAAGVLPREGMRATGDRLLPKLAGRASVLAEKAPVPTLVVMVLLGSLGYLGLINIDTEFSFTDFLPEDSPLLETLDLIDAEFAGGFGESTQVLVEGDDLATPAVYNAVVAGVDALATTPNVLPSAGPGGSDASVLSVMAIIDRLAAVGPDGAPLDPTFAGLAADAGYDVETRTMAPDADVATIIAAAAQRQPDAVGAVLHLEDGVATAALLDIGTQAGETGALELRDDLRDALAPIEAAGATVVPTSQNIITGSITASLASSQLMSLLITLLAATLVLVINFWVENRRPFLGVLTMIPVALVVLWTFGLMYVSGIPFGPTTATLTGLAVGIGVPYTIHMARRFEEDRRTYADVNEAIRATTRNTGGALVGSAFTTAAGFGILITSSLVPFQQLGQVVAYAILLSLFGALFVLPSLLVLWERWHQRRNAPSERRELHPTTVDGR